VRLLRAVTEMAAPALKTRETWAVPEGKLPPDDFALPSRWDTGPGKLWVVAIDGSQVSMRALRLAAFLMDTPTKASKSTDHLLAVHIIPTGVARDTVLEGTCKAEAVKCGLTVDGRSDHQFGFKTISMPFGWQVGDAIVYFANHVMHGHARLVLGAMGMDETKSPSKLGSIATQALAKSKVPVTVVKGPWGTTTGDRDPMGRPVRQGLDASIQTGLNIVCCVDGTSTGDVALDFAASLCREGDTLSALHIEGNNAARTVLAEQKYKAECMKIKESKKLAECAFSKERIEGSSIADSIAKGQAAANADVLVMGTVELVNISKRNTLGSVALGIAKRCEAHLCVVKNYGL